MISVLCVRGAGDKRGPDIQDDLVVTEHIARLRGEAYLDRIYYDMSTRTVRAPYQDVLDGEIADVRDPLVGLGNWHVQAVRIAIEPGAKVTLGLDLEGRYQDPE